MCANYFAGYERDFNEIFFYRKFQDDSVFPKTNGGMSVKKQRI